MRNKNNIRHKASTYKEWLDKREGYDPVLPENIADSMTPHGLRPLSYFLEDAYELLEEMFYTNSLKGRQKQIVNLLLKGELNETIIAKRLNMKQSNVSIEIKKIREKILKNF